MSSNIDLSEINQYNGSYHFIFELLTFNKHQVYLPIVYDTVTNLFLYFMNVYNSNLYSSALCNYCPKDKTSFTDFAFFDVNYRFNNKGSFKNNGLFNSYDEYMHICCISYNMFINGLNETITRNPQLQPTIINASINRTLLLPDNCVTIKKCDFTNCNPPLPKTPSPPSNKHKNKTNKTNKTNQPKQNKQTI
jgi:hypothetical protein